MSAEVIAPAELAECRHCGTKFVPVEGRSEFCCAGCEYVFRLISGQKLDRFYDLRRGATAPVRPSVFQPRDYRWLDGLVRRAEAAAKARGVDEATLDLDVQGISCVGCVWLIDRLFRDRAGARGSRINATLGRLTLRWTAGACDVAALAQELQRFGYLVGPATKTARSESGALLLRLGLCAAFAMNTMLFSLPVYLGMAPDFPFARLFTGLSFLFASASVVTGGTYFFLRSWRSLRHGVLHIDLPISLGILVGYAGSIYAWTQAAGGFTYFDFVSTFTFLMLVGRWTQLAAVERNRNRLLGLRQELPEVELLEADSDVARRESGGVPAALVGVALAPSRDSLSSERAGAPPAPTGVSHRAVTTKPAEALDRGERFLVAPGQIVPVSSTLLGPAASLGLDWISGESEARAVAPGQIVESGAMNLSPHALRLEALEPWATSLLARLFAVQPPSEWRNRTLERFIRGYLVAVIVVAAVGGAAWLALTGDVTRTLQVVVSVLVVSCPCALGVTLPLIDEIAVARLRNAGVFVRSDTLWARLGRLRKIIFDKTGTLTLESLVLRNPGELAALSPEARAALWTLVRASRHPTAACLRESMLAAGFEETGAANDGAAVREEVGFGLECRDAADRLWRLGRPAWAAESSTSDDAPATDVALACGGQVLARFVTAEEVREDAAAEVATLRRRGLEVFILSGDRPEKVAAMAARLGLPASSSSSSMTPEGKAAWVRQLDRGDTLMIGDGANDSLAFEAAACRGTPAVERGMLEQRADFFFLGRGLAGIRRLLDAALLRRRTTRVVLGFALLYNLAVVAVALAGAMSPLLAAVLMPASAIASLALGALGMRRA